MKKITLILTLFLGCSSLGITNKIENINSLKQENQKLQEVIKQYREKFKTDIQTFNQEISNYKETIEAQNKQLEARNNTFSDKNTKNIEKNFNQYEQFINQSKEKEKTLNQNILNLEKERQKTIEEHLNKEKFLTQEKENLNKDLIKKLKDFAEYKSATEKMENETYQLHNEIQFLIEEIKKTDIQKEENSTKHKNKLNSLFSKQQDQYLKFKKLINDKMTKIQNLIKAK